MQDKYMCAKEGGGKGANQMNMSKNYLQCDIIFSTPHKGSRKKAYGIRICVQKRGREKERVDHINVVNNTLKANKPKAIRFTDSFYCAGV